MSSPGEGSSNRPTNPSHYYVPNQSHYYVPNQPGQEIPPPIDGVSLMNYQFTFEQNVDNAVTASFRIEADPHPSQTNSPDTHSITSSISKYRVENGRTFHAYKDGSYMYPNDEEELDRQDFQYVIIKHLMNGRLFLAPWSQDNPPRNVLDIATGRGQWAIEMGDMFPAAKITGTDLSPVQPRDVPANVRFFVEDSRDPWNWYGENDQLDYIHTRLTLGCWEDPKTDILQKSFDQLVPGGYFEAQEALSTILCDDDTMKPDYELKVHLEDLEDATAAMKRPLRTADQWKRLMREVGFVDVQEVTYKMPINGWARNRKYKELGKMWEHNWIDCIHALSVGPLHRVRGLNDKQIQMMLIPVRQAISDQSVHAYNKFYVVWGRKPHPEEQVNPCASESSEPSGPLADTEMSGVS
ncbi:putative Secondary metabolism regulator LAE1 [Seiridium unicorne]|uniref:Secondary metabolism regulator LAE1 n=1 Tax=Seiridium unicorne TaxID=138068 RepID=A0ABR2VH23_9PEZI